MSRVAENQPDLTDGEKSATMVTVEALERIERQYAAIIRLLQEMEKRDRAFRQMQAQMLEDDAQRFRRCVQAGYNQHKE